MRHIDYLRAVMYYGRQRLPELKQRSVPPPSVWVCWIDVNDWLVVGKSNRWISKQNGWGFLATDLANTQAYTVYKDFGHIHDTRTSLERNTEYFIDCSGWAFLADSHAAWLEGQLIAAGQPNGGVERIYMVTEEFYEQYTTIGD
jgi:hypothetical protein